MYRTIQENTQGSVIEKKSRFIAQLFFVQSVEEAEKKIKEVRKQYYDAKHHCYAYRILTEQGIVEKCSDDGEPSGTAGAPMLNLLQKGELVNVIMIVTRYFGGILLGTGGLVRAYVQASQEALKNVQLVEEQKGYLVQLKVSYSDFEKCQYYCKKQKIRIVEIQYDENIQFMIEVTKEEKEEIEKKRQEMGFVIQNFTVLEEKIIRKNIEK